RYRMRTCFALSSWLRHGTRTGVCIPAAVASPAIEREGAPSRRLAAPRPACRGGRARRDPFLARSAPWAPAPRTVESAYPLLRITCPKVQILSTCPSRHLPRRRSPARRQRHRERDRPRPVATERSSQAELEAEQRLAALADRRSRHL